MLFVEVQQLTTTVASAMLHGGAIAAAASGEVAQETSEVLTQRAAPDVTARKREGWETKVARIGASSELAKDNPGWKLTSLFVKSNDDLRQASTPLHAPYTHLTRTLHTPYTRLTDTSHTPYAHLTHTDYPVHALYMP